jgi:RNA polymerase sigma-70 factor (ECF subfamily)
MTDDTLVSRLQANDNDAYREVLARYGNALYGYVYRLTGDQQLSEDILSETYLRMVERIDRFTFVGTPFKAWLYRVAYNLAMDALKARRRSIGYDDLALVTGVEDPLSQVITWEEWRDLRAALTHLTSEQQQVVLLRFVAEQSPGEVARILNKTENAVKQMQWRALRSLARLLAQPDALVAMEPACQHYP